MPTYNLEAGSVQWLFNQSRKPIQIFGGAYGNGKSAGLCIKTIQIVADYPGCNCVLARETYPKLNDTLRKEFFKWCPQAWIKRMPTKDDNTVYFHNGSVVNFRYVNQRGKATESGDTTSNLLSATYDLIGIDQFEDPGITFKDFQDLSGRLRGTTPYRPASGDEDMTMPRSGPRWLLLACNPNHGWGYKRLVLPYIIWRDRGVKVEDLLVDPRTREPILELFESTTYANSKNLPEDYIRRQESILKGQSRDRFLLGKWAAYEGLIYPDYDEHRHMVIYDQVIAYLEMLRWEKFVKLEAIEGYDYGLVKPSCYIFGVRDDLGRIILLDGFYTPGIELPIEEQAAKIKAIRAKYDWIKVTDAIRADPSIFKRTQVAGYKSTGVTIASLFKDEGIDMKPAANDIAAGITKVNGYIIGSPYVDNPFNDDDVGETKPLMYVTETLHWWHSEISNYFWRKNPFGQYEDEPTGGAEDHAMDVTKYIVSNLPEASKVVVPKSKIVPAWMRWQEVEETRKDRFGV